MKISGYEVPQEAMRAVTLAIRSQVVPFQHGDVVTWLVRHGIPYRTYIASEVANRLLQWERKNGHITFRNGRWHTMPLRDTQTGAEGT